MDYHAYEKPNDDLTTNLARGFLMKLPNNQKIFYGNYGGLGSNGGLPIDQMDELFRRHDIVYTEASTLKVIRVSDEVLVRYLKQIPDSGLHQTQKDYRDRAIKFFESPISKCISKPCSALFRFKEPVDSPFPNAESVIFFFSKNHSGFPFRES